MKTCRSPYIVSFFGAHFSDGDVELLIEYMDLGSIDSICRKFGCIEQNVAVHIIYNALKGLDYLWSEKKIVHRGKFEERQRYEKQMFEHQNDEQTVKALSQQLNQSRDFAKTNLKYMDEVHSVFEHLSEIVNGFSPPEDKEVFVSGSSLKEYLDTSLFQAAV